METVWSNNVQVSLTWKKPEDSIAEDLYLNDLFVGFVFYNARQQNWSATTTVGPLTEDFDDSQTFLPTQQEAKDHLVDTILKGLNNVSNVST